MDSFFRVFLIFTALLCFQSAIASDHSESKAMSINKQFDYWAIELMWASLSTDATVPLSPFKKAPTLELQLTLLMTEDLLSPSDLARTLSQTEKIFRQCKIAVNTTPLFYRLDSEEISNYGKFRDKDQQYLELMQSFASESLPIMILNNDQYNLDNDRYNNHAAFSILRDSEKNRFFPRFDISQESIPQHGVFLFKYGLKDYVIWNKEHLLLAHEILHVLTDDSDKYNGYTNNLLDHSISFREGPLMGLQLTTAQCQKARQYITKKL